MKTDKGIIFDIAYITAILSCSFCDKLLVGSYAIEFGQQYKDVIAQISNTSVHLYRTLELELADRDALGEVCINFGVESYEELIVYLGGKHMREVLKLNV